MPAERSATGSPIIRDRIIVASRVMPLLKALAHPDNILGTQHRKFSDRDHRPRISEYSSKRRAIPCRKNGRAAVAIRDEHWRTQASVRQGQPSGVTCRCVTENRQPRANSKRRTRPRNIDRSRMPDPILDLSRREEDHNAIGAGTRSRSRADCCLASTLK